MPVATIKEKNLQETKLSLWQASILLFGLTYGTPTLTNPFLVSLAGCWPYILIYFTVYLTVLYTGFLQAECSVMALIYYGENSIHLDAMPKIGKLAFGCKVYSIFCWIQMIILAIIYCSLLLLSGSILAELLPITGISNDNMTRISIGIATVVIIPFIFKSSYSELGLTSIISAAVMMICTFLIQLMCFHISRSYKETSDSPQKYDLSGVTTAYGIFNIIGTVFFCIISPLTVSPALVTHMKKPDDLGFASFLTFTATILVSFIAAFLPYSLLPKGSIHPTIITTLVLYGEKNTLYNVLLYIISVLLLFHFAVACVITIYPCFFMLQKWFPSLQDNLWRRNLMRIAVIIFLGFTSIIFTSIRAVFSFIGGGPLTLYCVVLPLCCHYKLSKSTFKPLITYMLIGAFSIVVAIGSFVIDTRHFLANDN